MKSRFLSFLAVLVVGSVGVGSATAAHASTTTFNFDAVYNASSPGTFTSGDVSNLTDLGAGLVDGQTIHGSFTVDTNSSILSTGSYFAFYSGGSVSATVPFGVLSTSSAISVVSAPVSFNPQSYFAILSDTNLQVGEHLLNYRFDVVLSDSSGTAFNTFAIPTSLNLPNFDLRSFSIAGNDVFAPDGIGQYASGRYQYFFDLTALTQISDIPEPSTWAMMLLGFVGIGAMTYRRRKLIEA